MKDMGNQEGNHKIPNNKQFPQLNTDEEDYQWDQFIETNDCCSFRYKKIDKKKLLWEVNFQKNIIQIQSQYHRHAEWCQAILNLIKKSKYPRKRFYVQVNSLKYQVNNPKLQQQQQILSEDQVNFFKFNLKRSIIISHTQFKKSLNSNRNSFQSLSNKSGKYKQKHQKHKNQVKNLKKHNQTQKSLKLQNKSNFEKSSSYSIMRSSMMSLFDEALAEICGVNKQITKQASASLEIFIHFTMILQKHLNNPSCALFNINQSFVSYVVQKYAILTTILSQQLEKKQKHILDDLIDAVSLFLELMNDTIYDYYSLKVFLDSTNTYNLITNRQNTLSIVTAILFKNENFYQFIFESAINYNKQKQAQFRLGLDRIKNTQPQYFQISKQYCLNPKYINKHDGSPSIDVSQFEIHTMSNSSTELPYSSCIETLQKLSKAKSPIAKMKIIFECAEGITDCVKKFYVSHGFEAKQWILDADQILSIFCYLIVKANIPHLHSHLFILQNFSTQHQLISATGYYYSVISCAIQQIQKSVQRSLDNHLSGSH